MSIRSWISALTLIFLSFSTASAQVASVPDALQSTPSEENDERAELYSVQFRVFADDQLYAAPTAVVGLGEEALIEYGGKKRYKLQFRLEKESADTSSVGSGAAPFVLIASLALPKRYSAEEELVQALAPTFTLDLGAVGEMTSEIRSLFVSDGSKDGVVNSLRYEAIISNAELAQKTKKS